MIWKMKSGAFRDIKVSERKLSCVSKRLNRKCHRTIVRLARLYGTMLGNYEMPVAKMYMLK